MNKLSILGIFVADLAFFGKIPKVGETILGEDFVVGPGGKGSNQSVAAGKAGASIDFITKVGDDDYGKMAYRIYKETNVGSDYVYISKEHSTGVAAILLNKDTGENAISVVPGAAGALTIQDIDNAKDVIINSSIFLTQLEAPMEVVVHALKIAKENKVTTILNPAPAAKLDSSVFPLVDYFTPNESEASFYVSGEIKNRDDAEKYGQEFLDLGVKNLLVTLGDQGVYFQNNNEKHFEPSLSLGSKVIDTSGAGDAFSGAFATALCEEKSISDSIKFANAFAGISTTRIGTANSMPSREEIDKII
ncbi:MAG: ribokinase [Alphaproteobacteria bacterium]